MPTYYHVLTHTEPDTYHPKGNVIHGGFYYSEDELQHALDNNLLPPGDEHQVNVLEAKDDGAFPTEWTKRRKKHTIETTTKVS